MYMTLLCFSLSPPSLFLSLSPSFFPLSSSPFFFFFLNSRALLNYQHVRTAEQVKQTCMYVCMYRKKYVKKKKIHANNSRSMEFMNAIPSFLQVSSSTNEPFASKTMLVGVSRLYAGQCGSIVLLLPFPFLFPLLVFVGLGLGFKSCTNEM